MKKLIFAGFASILAVGPARAEIADFAGDPSRLEEHVVRDESRKPAEILKLTGVRKGDKVADLAAGSGYYTALLSRIVGDSGKVYAVNPQRIFEAFPNARNAFPDYLEKDPRENIDYSIQKFDELTFAEPLDAVFMVLYYHDTLWTGADRNAMNKAIFDALKPGGLYLVIDHNARDGADKMKAAKQLHRMIPGVVKPEVLDAGFELAAESNVLSTPDDPLDDSVFADHRRGKTDRFVYLFRKP